VKAGALVAGKYRIIRKLGEGGMGSVWLAKNEVTERDFAIKFLHASKERTADQLKRFFQEAKVAGRLRHPAIVEIFDAGSDPSLGDAPYLVMELLDGLPLDEAIRRAGALPLGVALEIVLTASRALELAHGKGIIHRDLKPSNVFLHRVGDGSLVAKVLDFGISKVLVDDTTGKHVTGMTRTGAVLGSPLYMSPEQAAGDKSIDARSDVHALGVLLWECLVGRPPFESDTYGLLLVEIIQGERPRLSSVLPSVPHRVSELMGRAIARKREDRIANAGELADAIERELDALGHVPMLSGRNGAADFFELVGTGHGQKSIVASRTTAAVEVPKSDDGAGAAVRAASGAATPDTSELGANHPIPTDTAAVTPKRSPWLGIVGAGGALAVVAAVGITLVRAGQPPAAPSAEPGVGATAGPAATVLPTAEPAAESQGASTVSSPDAEAPTPSAAPAKEPVAIQPPKPSNASSAANAPAKTQPKAKPTKPPPPATGPAAKPTAPPVHHGVTSSGL